jgi:hypothetical protein
VSGIPSPSLSIITVVVDGTVVVDDVVSSNTAAGKPYQGFEKPVLPPR